MKEPSSLNFIESGSPYSSNDASSSVPSGVSDVSDARLAFSGVSSLNRKYKLALIISFYRHKSSMYSKEGNNIKDLVHSILIHL